MNRLLLSACILGLATAAIADGPININNFIDGVTRPINFPNTSGPFGGPFGGFDGTGVMGATWRAQFFAQDGTPIGAPVGFRSAGRLDFRAPNTADRTVTGTPGVAQNITVGVWDTSVFPTWNDATQALSRGDSGPSGITAVGQATFSYTIPVGTPPPIGADRILNFQAFNLIALVAVPEPATTALGAAGAITLLWQGLRRKRENSQAAV